MTQILEYDVVVIGAGIAGLAAARKLAEERKRVALLEARDRVGGRIFTIAAQEGSLPVELGAEFIHGLPPELIELVKEAGLTRFELEGEVRCLRRDIGGFHPVPCDQHGAAFDVLEQLQRDPVLQITAKDLSFREYLALRNIPADVAQQATSYVEGFNAADGGSISVASLAKQQEAEDTISGDRLFRVVEGYMRLPEYLLGRFREADGSFFPSTRVEIIRWSQGDVEVETSSDENPMRHAFRAARAVITLPLGVLQRRVVAFDPSPARILAAADQMVMGSAARVVLEFREGFWREFPDLEAVSFLFASEATPATWWTTSPKKSGLLTGWVGGRQTQNLDVARLPETGLETLAMLLGRTKAQLSTHLAAAHVHDWQTDRCSIGAYSYVPKGAIGAPDEMVQPVENTLFFAGEHTDTTGHWGTVHGALGSGYRAARQVSNAVTELESRADLP